MDFSSLPGKKVSVFKINIPLEENLLMMTEGMKYDL